MLACGSTTAIGPHNALRPPLRSSIKLGLFQNCSTKIGHTRRDISQLAPSLFASFKKKWGR